MPVAASMHRLIRGCQSHIVEIIINHTFLLEVIVAVVDKISSLLAIESLRCSIICYLDVNWFNKLISITRLSSSQRHSREVFDRASLTWVRSVLVELTFRSTRRISCASCCAYHTFGFNKTVTIRKHSSHLSTALLHIDLLDTPEKLHLDVWKALVRDIIDITRLNDISASLQHQQLILQNLFLLDLQLKLLRDLLILNDLIR